MADLGSFCDSIFQVSDPSDTATLLRIASESDRFMSSSDAIIDSVSGALEAATDDNTRLALWLLVDRLCKQQGVYIQGFSPRLVQMAERAGISPKAAAGQAYSDVLDSLRFAVGSPLIALIKVKLEAKFGAPVSAPASNSNAQVPSASDPSQKALIVHSQQAKSIGGFTTGRGNNARAENIKHSLQVKTRDSHMAMSQAAAYAPARPQEIAMAPLVPDANAQEGFMQALPAGHTENYLLERRKRQREIFQKNREDREEKEQKEKLARAGGSKRDFSDVKMPEELPRDQYGVKIANYPAGVRFIREAVRACGGAVELEVLQQRISQMAESEAIAEFGELRTFLTIHTPTFRVEREGGDGGEDRWVVRIVGDQDPEDVGRVREGKRVWQEAICPLCQQYINPGRNIARHRNNRQCIEVQMAQGLAGRITSPISEMAYAAKQILSRPIEFDDDDLLYFARGIEASGEVRRFKFASTRIMDPIIKAIRTIRDRWLAERRAPNFDVLQVYPEDRAYCAFFETLGDNFNRLPIPWIETGDICDMCRRFSSKVKTPFTAPPRAGDPRIRITSEYPGMMFCTSDTDEEDKLVDPEEVFSDDEAPAFEFAPPVSVCETIMTAGFSRDMKKLSHRLRTAPPMQLQRVLKSDQTSTAQQLYDTIKAADKGLPTLGGPQQPQPPKPAQPSAPTGPRSTTF